MMAADGTRLHEDIEKVLVPSAAIAERVRVGQEIRHELGKQNQVHQQAGKSQESDYHKK